MGDEDYLGAGTIGGVAAEGAVHPGVHVGDALAAGGTAEGLTPQAVDGVLGGGVVGEGGVEAVALQVPELLFTQA